MNKIIAFLEGVDLSNFKFNDNIIKCFDPDPCIEYSKSGKDGTYIIRIYKRYSRCIVQYLWNNLLIFNCILRECDDSDYSLIYIKVHDLYDKVVSSFKEFKLNELLSFKKGE